MIQKSCRLSDKIWLKIQVITACSGSMQTDRCSKERLDAPWAT
jgi:hypothetical protein